MYADSITPIVTRVVVCIVHSIYCTCVKYYIISWLESICTTLKYNFVFIIISQIQLQITHICETSECIQDWPIASTSA